MDRPASRSHEGCLPGVRNIELKMRTVSTQHVEMTFLAFWWRLGKNPCRKPRRRCFDCCIDFAAGFLFGPVLGPGERIVITEPARWVKTQPPQWEGASPAQGGSSSSFKEEECRQAEVDDGGLG